MSIVRTSLPQWGRKRVARRRGWSTVVALVLLTTVGFGQRGAGPALAGDTHQESAPGPAGDSERLSFSFGALPPAARARISAAIGEDEPAYHAVGGRRLRMNTPSRGVAAEFTPEGVSFHAGAHHWGSTVRGYGYGDNLREADATVPRAAANRVEYRRGALTEWYANGPLGLEQGFTLERAPAHPNGEPLTLALALSGNVNASVDPGGRSLTLRKDGFDALRYGGLTAVDADGREMQAWLEADGARLRVRVDAADARFPLTFDHYVQAANLTTTIPCSPSGVCDDGAPGDHFGYAVSISDDASTVVVGVPYKYTNSVARGAAYVFVKPDDALGGWNSPQPIFFKAKLLASDGATSGLNLGWSTDISRDGGTIVVGAPALTWTGRPPSGAAYVFVRPANGWGTLAVQMETARLATARRADVDHRGSLGTSVAISGDGGAIAAGAPDQEIDSVHYGAAYLYLRRATGWITANESQEIRGTSRSFFGGSVALSEDGTTVIVGAYGENPTGGQPDETGAAYVFAGSGVPESVAPYSTATRLAASDGLPLDIFGLQ